LTNGGKDCGVACGQSMHYAEGMTVET